MKLEVGMYVRTIGGIERLKKENDNGWFFEKSMIIKPDNIEKYIIKASYNIIDLIEVGDYINGFPVIHKENDILKCGLLVQFKENEIKSVITHERMEQMAYHIRWWSKDE